MNQCRGPDEIGATATEGFAQGPHLKREVCIKAEVFGRSSSMRSHHTCAMGIIDIEFGLIVLG